MRPAHTGQASPYFLSDHHANHIQAAKSPIIMVMEAVQGWLDATTHIAARLESLTDVEKAEVVELLVDRVGLNGKEI